MVSNKKSIFCIPVMAAGYLAFSLAYFSQMYLMYDYFDADTIYIVCLGWCYLAQAVGMAVFGVCYCVRPKISGNRYILTGIYIIGAILMSATVLIKYAPALIVISIFTNVVIGMSSGYCFTLYAAFIPQKHLGMSFGIAYAIGSIGTWLITLLDEKLLVSPNIIPIGCVLFGISAALAYFCGNLPNSFSSDGSEKTKLSHPKLLVYIVLVVLMMLVSSFGSNSYTLISADTGISAVTARCFYAVGLMIAGFIYDKSRTLGAISTLASLVFPLIATVLFTQNAILGIMCALSYFFLGFIAVYRAGVFMDFGKHNKLMLPFACVGLMISRIVEAATVFLSELFNNYIVCLLISGLLFIPLIVLFGVTQTKQSEQKEKTKTAEMLLAEFGERFNLTKREEEVLKMIVNGMSNGEIASTLNLSESTVRFHTSNIFKKTSCKSRVEVSRLFHQTTI